MQHCGMVFLFHFIFLTREAPGLHTEYISFCTGLPALFRQQRVRRLCTGLTGSPGRYTPGSFPRYRGLLTLLFLCMLRYSGAPVFVYSGPFTRAFAQHSKTRTACYLQSRHVRQLLRQHLAASVGSLIYNRISFYGGTVQYNSAENCIHGYTAIQLFY